MKKPFVTFSAFLLAIVSTTACASTVSQREYKRGFADCSAGRWDQNQHGASYKEGCAAAEAKRDGGKSAPADGVLSAGPAEGTVPAPERKVAAYIDPSVSGKDKRACLLAVKKQTKNTKLVVIGAESSEANNQVTVAVGPQRAPWKCLVKRGKVAEVMSMTDEGAL